MNTEEAKLILCAARPNGEDDADARCAEALDLVRQDPSLRAWWEQETALDRAIAAKLKQVPVPESLSTAILAGLHAQQTRPRARWLPRLALAASLAILIASAALWFSHKGGEPTLAAYKKQMLEVVSTGAESLDLETPDLAKVREHLAAKGNLVDFVVPTSMESLPTYGCQKLTWKGHRVALVCFKQSEFGAVHCFIIKTEDLPKPATPTPEVDQVGRWAIATWEKAGKTYMLAAYGEAERLKKLL